MNEKFECLRGILAEMESVAVAYSAGVDSTFLVRVAVDTLGADNVLAVTGRSPSLAAAEFDAAVRMAAEMGVEHLVIDTDEFADEVYRANPPDRCYHCKNNLFTHMRSLVAGRGIRWIVCGTNKDDFADWRPGHKAADENGVRCPIAEAGLTKADIRELSRALGLPTAEKPASPCLASRIPYGLTITAEKLSVIEKGEAFLKRELGITLCRVRHHEQVVRLEVPVDAIEALASADHRTRVDDYFKSLGFAYVAVDLRGFRRWVAE